MFQNKEPKFRCFINNIRFHATGVACYNQKMVVNKSGCCWWESHGFESAHWNLREHMNNLHQTIFRLINSILPAQIASTQTLARRH